ncbi:MAG: hypothetical protein ACK46L_00090 [Synechococcaceae cyanobacterium]
MATPPAPPDKPDPPALMRPAPPKPRQISAQDFRPFTPPPTAYSDQQLGLVGEVSTFDPVARAALIATEMPRGWSGDYRPFDNPSKVFPVQLSIASAVPSGQMVVIRGALRIGEVTSPIQANLNAKSDQLDMLLLGDRIGGEIEPGGEFMGLQGMRLSGLRGPRLITMGGRLQLAPAATAPRASGQPQSKTIIRGLW